MPEEPPPLCSARTGWCMGGQHTECPAVFGGGAFPDPSRKGATFTTPVYRCPCECHARPVV